MLGRSATTGLSPVYLTLFCPHLNHCSEGSDTLPAEERIPLGWRSCPKNKYDGMFRKRRHPANGFGKLSVRKAPESFRFSFKKDNSQLELS